MIQVAVGQYHEIEVSIPEERKIGCRLAPDFFGVQARVDNEGEMPKFDEKRIGSDATIPIEIS